MLDNQIIKIVRDLIIAGMTARGISGVSVKQSFQPTQQGANTAATVYLYKVSDKRYGFLGRKDVWNSAQNRIDHVETQQYETTFQVNALVIQDPSNINSLTASDIVNAVAGIIQSDTAINTFHTNGIGILRVTDVRNPYFVDDKGRHEASPNFDFTLTHKMIVSSTTPVIETVEFEINRV